MPKPLTVLAELIAIPGRRTELLEALRADRSATLANEVDVRFRILVDDANDACFVLHEEYPDAAAFEAHKAQPYFADFEAAVGQCCVNGAKVNVLTPAVTEGP